MVRTDRYGRYSEGISIGICSLGGFEEMTEDLKEMLKLAHTRWSSTHQVELAEASATIVYTLGGAT